MANTVTRVLFVCLGNICRSPAAQAIFRDLAAARGLDLFSDSAGTSDWHTGDSPYAPMIRAAAARGYDLNMLRARQFSRRDFAQFDLIIAMDSENVRDIQRLRPAGNETPVKRLLDYAPQTSVRDVPDPYFTGDFDGALDLIETANQGLLVHFPF